MIRYPVQDKELRGLIAAQAPTWLRRASSRTRRFRQAGRYSEGAGIWSEVKPVYVQLQHNKCGFCERKLADERRGLIEYDLEHFRPKSEVREWPPEAIRTERGYTFSTGTASATGYHLLAYHPWNYLVACKSCNTALKSSFFPVSASRRLDHDDPRKMLDEEPFLIYPLGDWDDDPADLLTFEGNLPIPRYRSGHRHRRAQVVIDFFELNIREDVLEERATWICAVWLAVSNLEEGTPLQRRTASTLLRQALSPWAPHSNCIRSFYDLVQREPKRAEEVVGKMNLYLESKGHSIGI